MPTYEYLCKKCEHSFEQVQKMSDDSLTVCPSCGESSLQRIINATAFHLKGTGWYKTDYAGDKTKKTTSGEELSSSDKPSGEKSSTEKSPAESSSTGSSSAENSSAKSETSASTSDKSSSKSND